MTTARATLSGPRRSLRRWTTRILVGLLAALFAVTAAGAAYEQVARRQVAHDNPPPGTLVDIGGRRIHLDCRGTGSPTVVFESGLDTNGSLSWAKVHDPVSATTRACAYDRAGIMWSDPTDRPQSGETIAADLHAALGAAGEKGPFILVAHSLGGPYATIYTKRYGDQVAGLVFVDASHPDQERRFAEAIGRPAAEGGFLEEAAGSLAWTGLPRLITSRVSYLDPELPSDAARQVNAYLPTSLPALFDEAGAVAATMAQAGADGNFGSRPLVVLTATAPTPPEELAAADLSVAQDESRRRVWKDLHTEEASWSTNSRHRLVPDSSHYIHLIRPDLVVDAVRDVITTIRSPGTELPTP